LIATMVGIVGILLLGSLAWSAVGALFSAVGDAAAAFTSSSTPTPRLALGLGTQSPKPAIGVATQSSTDRATPAPTLGSTPTALPATASTPAPETPTALTPTPSASGRAPWILLPLPAPGSRVPPGQQVIEARGRGDTAITAIHLELDGAALGVSLEQRSESTWRGSSTTQVTAGHHAVRATVTDDQNRTGSFKWTFDAGP
jgi:hypothetical protein